MSTRRTILTGLAALPLAPVPSLANNGQASPRMLELKAEFDAAWARQEVASARLDAAQDLCNQLKPLGPSERLQGAEDAANQAWEAWEPDYADATDIALDVMREPCASPADFAIKVTVADAALKHVTEADDDLEEYVGWMDRAMPRLFNEARALLGCPPIA
jgi:hypothetical protein